MREQIETLKKEKNAAVLAHYYVADEVQEIADYVGDSYYLAELATKLSADTIIFCGVSFMGESAKLLNPQKRVVMAEADADCPMAHMVDLERIAKIRDEYPDVAVVCYVNSTAEIKAYSDVCVTSSNALKIVSKLPNKDIFFIPDNQLGRYVAAQLPQKHFIFNDGYCHVHTGIEKEAVLKAKELHPLAKVLAHPECKEEVLELADAIGSTAQMIDYATNAGDREFIICTELGILYELSRKNPDKRFYAPTHNQFCSNMKKITQESVLHALQSEDAGVLLDTAVSERAGLPLKRMLELAK
ncbi:MAG: quinolinate synthase NadA [Lachnospiraceae bacterium]|nr:quinolinate synthase NadA [Lachnospiraceae bacterium]